MRDMKKILVDAVGKTAYKDTDIIASIAKIAKTAGKNYIKHRYSATTCL